MCKGCAKQYKIDTKRGQNDIDKQKNDDQTEGKWLKRKTLKMLKNKIKLTIR